MMLGMKLLSENFLSGLNKFRKTMINCPQCKSNQIDEFNYRKRVGAAIGGIGGAASGAAAAVGGPAAGAKAGAVIGSIGG